MSARSWAVVIPLSVLTVVLLSAEHALALPIVPSPATVAPSTGSDDTDPSEAVDSEGTAPATPPEVLNNPDCNAIVNNPVFQQTASNNKVLSKEQCAAFNDLLRNYNQTNQATEPSNRGILLLDPVFALNLDKMLRAAQAGGFRITIISGYRNPKNNPPGGAGAGSLHHRGLAADLCFPDAPCVKKDPRGSFHTCEQADASKVSQAYLWVYRYMSNPKNGLATLMQVFGRPPSAYPGECDHVRDITGAGGTRPVTNLTGGTGPGTSGGSGAGARGAAPSPQPPTPRPGGLTPSSPQCIVGGCYCINNTCTPTNANQQCTIFGCTTPNSISGNSSNDLMKQMMMMQMLQGLMGSLNSLGGSSNNQPTSQGQTSSNPFSTPTPLPAIPISQTPGTTSPSTGISTIDALIAALNQKTSSPTSTSPVACALDEKICPDGTSVGRIPPGCQFTPCPVTASTSVGQVQAVSPPPATSTSTATTSVTMAPGPISLSASESNEQPGMGQSPTSPPEVVPPSPSIMQGIFMGFARIPDYLSNFFSRMFGVLPTAR